jgi:hypothetical protein
MKTIQKSFTVSAKSTSAPTATKYVSDEILIFARDNNYSIVSVSHAMIQKDDVIEVTAIAIVQEIIY